MALSIREEIDLGMSYWVAAALMLERELDAVWDEAHSACFTYFMVDPETRKVKIGWTSDIKKRYLDIHGMNSGGLILFYYEVYPTAEQARARELYYHYTFAEYRDVQPSHYDRVDSKREWFRIEGELKRYMQQLYQRRLKHGQTLLNNQQQAQGD